MSKDYPRDMVGYGRDWPDPAWPGGARVAVQFVINYEEGAELNILHGDPASESLLSEFGFAMPGSAIDTCPSNRSTNMEAGWASGACTGFLRSGKFRSP